ncbi:MAG: transketolase [Lachnospiraceae bacterium]|nr:transketolase [Lachnospiraceae bacterium]
MKEIDIKSVNAIRVLSAEAIEKAKSGHPGLPLGAAPMAYELMAHHMNHNPKNPNWFNRDRFVLSAGHGSMLLYSLLHLFGYGDLSIEDIKNFRQMDSLTPGHPEYGHTVGVETTTGPLGAGFATAVGMAAAEAHLAAKFNEDGYDIVDHYTYVLAGDGCMMEGTSYEAGSLAGTWGLSKFIVLYDSNNISIEGGTDIAFRENVLERFEAFGFQILEVEDGNDTEAIGKAIEEAKADKTRPSFIKINTKIGAGCPAKEGKASAHGEPLGEDNLKALKDNLGWNYDAFTVPEEVYDNYKAVAEEGAKKEQQWNDTFAAYKSAHKDKAELFEKYINDIDYDAILNNEDFFSYEDKPQATRNLSGVCINKLKDIIPNLVGGSADLAPSTKTYMNDAGDFSKEDYSGRNFHFGVRELAMAAIGNGLLLHGGLRSYVSTFFVFSDYLKPMARLSALMKIPAIYVLTHDSIGVGEDGPTHEPIEQLAMFRTMPNFVTFRPADATETAYGWYQALSSKNTPTALVLSRQNLPQLEGSSKDALKGGYVVYKAGEGTPDGILMASGSEVSLAIDAAKKLSSEGIKVNVVSMPSFELFDMQDDDYKESVLPKAVRKRVAIEAANADVWYKYVGLDGTTVAMTGFGASAPGNLLFEKFGFTVDNVVNAFKGL